MNRNEKMIKLYGVACDGIALCKHCAHCNKGECDFAGKINPNWVACGKFERRV